jgi:hypothetical protein
VKATVTYINPIYRINKASREEALDKAFHKIKKIISDSTMLIFPDFNKVFEIHKDVFDYQVGSVISHNQKPIAFYSKKLTATQHNYVVEEREMFSIVETLNEFCTMFLGHKLKIYPDHKNLINLTTVSKPPQIQRWQWTIEKFSLVFVYINGPWNMVSDALSRIDTEMSHSTLNSIAILESFENPNYNILNIDYLLSTAVIAKHQQKDTTLVQHIKRHPEYFTKQVDGHNVIPLRNQMYIPTILRKEI